MQRQWQQRYHNTLAVLTSMHAKERVIEPVLRKQLGLSVELASGVNTDQFGTFSREVERTGSQLDAARAKIACGFDYAPQARVGVASEGSFGPHPSVPFMALGRELVLMIDRESGLELIGYDVSPATNFGHVLVRDPEQAWAFAESASFPDHGLIVMGWAENRPAPELILVKDIADKTELQAAIRNTIRRCGAAFVETDMRAHRNPTRMAAIERATRDLVARFNRRCPCCDQPGFDVTARIPGLPCAWCSLPTRMIVAEDLTCGACGHRQQRSVATLPTADPSQCNVCNP